MQTRAQHRRLVDDVVNRASPEIHLMIANYFRSSGPGRRDDELLPLTTWDFRPYHHNGKPDNESLRNLRLVNRAFSAGATTVFFESNCIVWPRSPDSTNPTEITKSKGKNNGTPSYAQKSAISHVAKHLKVHFLSPQNEDFRALRWSGGENEEKQLTWKLLSDFSRLIPQFKNLTFLSYGVGRWENEGPYALLSPFIPFATERFEKLGPPLGGCVLEYLTALKLHLPSTYTFNLAFDSLGSEVLGRLKHLFLEITDKTGEGGTRSKDGEYGTPMSNYLQQYPIKEQTGEFFRWISTCTSLESFSITAAQLLDTNELKWRHKGEGLKMLDLHRVLITPTLLNDLMSTSGGIPSPTITKVSLIGVQLVAGTWDQVFRHMDRLPALAYFCPLNLGYSKKGSTGHFCKGSPCYEYKPLWTRHGPDTANLLPLYQKLDALATAAGLKYPNGRGENGVVPGVYLDDLFHYKSNRPPFLENLE